MAPRSRPERTRSLPTSDVQAEHVNLGDQATLDFRGVRGLEEEFDGLAQVGLGLLDGAAPARDVQFGAKGDEPIALSLDDRRQGLDPRHGRAARYTGAVWMCTARPTLDGPAKRRFSSSCSTVTGAHLPQVRAASPNSNSVRLTTSGSTVTVE